jgi:hypothetical protein
MRKLFVVLFLSVALLSFFGNETEAARAMSFQEPSDPVVPQVEIIPPAPGLPAEKAFLSGKFYGELRPNNGWTTGFDLYNKIVVIVKRIDVNGADILYCWGDAPSWAVTGGNMEARATFDSEGKLCFSKEDRTWLLYGQNGTVIFERIRSSGNLKAIMKRR